MASATTQHSETRQKLWQTLFGAHGRVQTMLEKALQEAGLPPLSWYEVLHPISISTDRMLRPRDLGCGVQISRSGLTRLLDRMESAGAIERKRCDEDRRGSYIGLTEAGAATAQAMREVVEGELSSIFGELYDEDEAERLIDLLGRAASA